MAPQGVLVYLMEISFPSSRASPPAKEEDNNNMMRVINEASNNKAARSDDIPYEMIKNLGEKALEMLLHLYNRCWEGEGIPTKWREATIKTLLKEDKDPKDPTSYRPISLTSCLGKILEKIIANRLIFILESRGILSNNQAGFRPGRCTTDQLLKLVQEASDNIHEKPRVFSPSG